MLLKSQSLRKRLLNVLLVCFLILGLNEASVQETVQGFIGESAVLPCRTPKRPDVFNAHWRYDDSKNVYDMADGELNPKEQDPVYKNRTNTFPTEHSKGNFSLKLGNVQSSDAGTYCCFLPDFNLQSCIALQVKEKPRGIQENPGSNRGIKSRAERIVSLLIPFFTASFLLWLCEW